MRQRGGRRAPYMRAGEPMVVFYIANTLPAIAHGVNLTRTFYENWLLAKGMWFTSCDTLI